MTDQVFEKAQDIKARINMISEVISCIKQCRISETHSQYALAAIEVQKEEGYIAKQFKVQNHVIVEDDILHDVETLLWQKYEESCKEFDAL